MRVIHGDTDAGPRVRIDLSTNANPYGPSPFARQAMATSIAAYPDPSYTDTRRALELLLPLGIEGGVHQHAA